MTADAAREQLKRGKKTAPGFGSVRADTPGNPGSAAIAVAPWRAPLLPDDIATGAMPPQRHVLTALGGQADSSRRGNTWASPAAVHGGVASAAPRDRSALPLLQQPLGTPTRSRPPSTGQTPWAVVLAPRPRPLRHALHAPAHEPPAEEMIAEEAGGSRKRRKHN